MTKDNENTVELSDTDLDGVAGGWSGAGNVNATAPVSEHEQTLELQAGMTYEQAGNSFPGNVDNPTPAGPAEG
ncbi:hypothetical protein [Streptomyces lunalinharesii]|uniref:Bacteriocin n=1 Tax=Streptomyces lunalinharesii TaxID=333384 RepID=A0ABP6F4U9_9ACTN